MSRPPVRGLARCRLIRSRPLSLADFNEIGVLQAELRRRPSTTRLLSDRQSFKAMQNPKHLNLLINAGGALVGIIVVGYVALFGVSHRSRAAVQRPLSGGDALLAANAARANR